MILAWYSNISCRFFFSLSFFQYFKYILPFPSGLQSFCWKSLINHMAFPLYVTSCFSLAAFNILSSCLISGNLISMCLNMFLLGFILLGILCTSWTWLTISHAGEVFNYNLFKIFLSAFLILFSIWDPYNSNVGVFNIVPEVSETIPNSFHSFSFILLFNCYLHHSIFQLTYPFFSFC